MKKEGTHITAESGCKLVRISDGADFGADAYLGYTYYLNGEKLTSPILELPEHFTEVELTTVEIIARFSGQNLSKEEVKEGVCEVIDAITDRKIISGFKWEGTPVWLSMEAQVNYKAAYDLAVQTNGATLPTTFKIGTVTEPVYLEFSSVETLSAFILAIFGWINSCLSDGWERKDAAMKLIDQQNEL